MKTNLSPEEEVTYKKHFNARFWFSWGLTLFLGVILIPVFDFFSLNIALAVPSLIIAGVGIWILILWNYLPHPVRFFKYLWNNDTRDIDFITRLIYLVPPTEDDARELTERRVYIKNNPLLNILIAGAIFSLAYGLYLFFIYTEAVGL